MYWVSSTSSSLIMVHIIDKGGIMCEIYGMINANFKALRRSCPAVVHMSSDSALSLGGVLALTGTCLLVTFAPHSAPHVTANMVERCLISLQFLIYFVGLPNQSHWTQILKSQCLSLFRILKNKCILNQHT